MRILQIIIPPTGVVEEEGFNVMIDWASSVATSQAVWSILCIILAAVVIRELRKDRKDTIDEMKEDRKGLIKLYEESKQESKTREQQLMSHLERSNTSQEETTTTLVAINNTLGILESRVDRIERMSYREAMFAKRVAVQDMEFDEHHNIKGGQ